MIQYMIIRLSVQSLMQEMERLQAKGEVTEEILHAMEEDMTGKVHIPRHVLLYVQAYHLALQILLASWRGTRFEVVQVLREVNHFSTRKDVWEFD